MTCPRCGCLGYGSAQVAVCSRCHQVKFPVLPEAPGKGWVCALCQATRGTGRRERARKGASTSKSKPQGGTIARDL